MELEDLTREEKLRLNLILQKGIEQGEMPLVIRFLKGDDSSLEELERRITGLYVNVDSLSRKKNPSEKA